jgi:hypothetical protein
MPINWLNVMPLGAPRRYVCSYCDNLVGPNIGWHGKQPDAPGAFTSHIYICSFCNNPTYFDIQNIQFPGPAFGRAVASVPQEVAALYGEARSCMTVNAFTSAVLTCRKLLMHIAVEKGAPVLQQANRL